MKNLLRSFPILEIVLLLKLSACETEDVITIKKNLVEVYKWPSTFTNVSVKSEPILWIDSVAAATDSTYRIYSHVRYDSVLHLTELLFNYWEEDLLTPEVSTITKIIGDTLNFEIQQQVAYTITLDSLKHNTTYRICGQGKYLELSDTILFAGICYSFRTD